MPQWPWRKPRPGVDNYGRSTLWYHAAEGDEAAVRRDLKAGLSATAADKDGYGALHVAAQNAQLHIVRLLLAAGADPNAIDRHGNGALWVACYEAGKMIATDANRGIVVELLQAGADPHHVNNAGARPTLWRTSSPNVDAIFAAAGIARASGE